MCLPSQPVSSYKDHTFRGSYYVFMPISSGCFIRGREGRGREGKGREGKGREGKGREGCRCQ